MYLVTREIDFCYGHRLLNYDGKCRHLHGHNGRVVITLQSETLDHRGMVIDFSDIKNVVSRWIDEQLDHRMILCKDDPVVPLLEDLGEPLHLIDANPTAENIAKLTPPSTSVAPNLSGSPGRISSAVTVWQSQHRDGHIPLPSFPTRHRLSCPPAAWRGMARPHHTDHRAGGRHAQEPQR